MNGKLLMMKLSIAKCPEAIKPQVFLKIQKRPHEYSHKRTWY